MKRDSPILALSALFEEGEPEHVFGEIKTHHFAGCLFPMKTGKPSTGDVSAVDKDWGFVVIEP